MLRLTGRAIDRPSRDQGVKSVRGLRAALVLQVIVRPDEADCKLGTPFRATAYQAGAAITGAGCSMTFQRSDSKLFAAHNRKCAAGQDGQNETEQLDRSASSGDSITSSTRIRLSVHTTCKMRSRVASGEMSGMLFNRPAIQFRQFSGRPKTRGSVP
jgi:hypothetical protein